MKIPLSSNWSMRRTTLNSEPAMICSYNAISINLVLTSAVCLMHKAVWVSSWMYAILNCVFARSHLHCVCGNLLPFTIVPKHSVTSSDDGKSKAFSMEGKLDIIKCSEKGESVINIWQLLDFHLKHVLMCIHIEFPYKR